MLVASQRGENREVIHTSRPPSVWLVRRASSSVAVPRRNARGIMQIMHKMNVAESPQSNPLDMNLQVIS